MFEIYLKQKNLELEVERYIIKNYLYSALPSTNSLLYFLKYRIPNINNTIILIATKRLLIFYSDNNKYLCMLLLLEEILFRRYV